MSCCNFRKVTPTVTETNVVLTPTVALTVTNKQHFCFKLTASIPSTAAALPVVITANGTTYSLYNKYVNPVYGADLVTCKCYQAFYGDDPSGHVSLPKTPVTFNCASTGNVI